jgi:hypothetical protein
VVLIYSGSDESNAFRVTSFGPYEIKLSFEENQIDVPSEEGTFLLWIQGLISRHLWLKV